VENMKNKTAENKKIVINISGLKNFIAFEYILVFQISEPCISSVSVIPDLKVRTFSNLAISILRN